MSRTIKKYIEIIQNTEELPKNLEFKYIKEARYNQEFKRLLFNAQLKLVMQVAGKYTNHVETYEDLIQEGVKGLEQALIFFKPSKKVRFNTYARYWIRAHILKYFSDNVRGFKVPVDIAVKLYQINKAIEKLSKKSGEEPTNVEIAKVLSYDPDYIGWLRKYLLPHGSIDAPISKNSSTNSITTISDSMPDNHRDDASESLIRTDNIDIIKKAIKQLPKKEKFVIQNRYGLNGEGNGDGRTLLDIGKDMKLTAERVRQLQRQGEKRLRKIMNR